MDGADSVGIDGFAGRLDPEVCVVTAASGGERAGCLVGFAAQCSLRPVRFAVWLSELNRTHEVAGSAEFLAVHLLARDQRALAERFGGRTGHREDKFRDVRWREGYGGAVVLADVEEWFVGRVVARVDGGDHTGFVLDPVDSGRRGAPERPLMRQSDAITIRPGHPVD
ncbi:flavin reductase family protein [Streptomyces griseoviridis]|uniref:Flavin reductase (DIM6/NTAB) family NADH-FMN oxidoreductase RutF n=3 Tax=Streptomyces TaxID=1883 RepID=A0ABT9LQU2_STRGD|nr:MULTISPECIES: flavin reductase family protein [Streptomyces]MDP9685920.1 flavin reductase (DIM6/NTAB) family NADH-FMN oxidoreductase RutF [Streptomyces griseoviridis]GGS42721.1 oxidoreductase [Streptomyces niveoruber]GGS78161.1 oxidoreductase [Streptomyces griseoviridis]GGU15544.1 oxidoreductase [Streptomyces daghestanicus]GHI35208.1 oxidoreductase [Streptomyces daghestanicus]